MEIWIEFPPIINPGASALTVYTAPGKAYTGSQGLVWQLTEVSDVRGGGITEVVGWPSSVDSRKW